MLHKTSVKPLIRRYINLVKALKAGSCCSRNRRTYFFEDIRTEEYVFFEDIRTEEHVFLKT